MSIFSITSITPAAVPALGWRVRYRKQGSSDSFITAEGSPFTSLPITINTTDPVGTKYEGLIERLCSSGSASSPFQFPFEDPCVAPGVVLNFPTLCRGEDFTYEVPITGTAPFELEYTDLPDWMSAVVSGNKLVFSGNPGPPIIGPHGPLPEYVKFDLRNCGGPFYQDNYVVDIQDCTPEPEDYSITGTIGVSGRNIVIELNRTVSCAMILNISYNSQYSTDYLWGYELPANALTHSAVIPVGHGELYCILNNGEPGYVNLSVPCSGKIWNYRLQILNPCNN